MKKILSYLPLLLLLTAASCTQSLYTKGNARYNNKQYKEAIPYYEKLLKHNDNPQALTKLAECYRINKDYAKAEAAYKKMEAQKLLQPVDKLYLAQVLKANGKCEEGRDWYEQYKHEMDKNATYFVYEDFCEKATKYRIGDYDYQLKPLALENGMSSFSPVMNGTEIVFLSQQKSGLLSSPDNKGFFDLYTGKPENNKITNIKALPGSVNTIYQEGPATFNTGGDVMYFTRSGYVKRKLLFGKNNENNLGIFKAHLVNDKWQDIEDFKFNNKDYSVGHPSLSPDNQYLYFVSDMPGGFGGTDIYYSKNENGRWGKPVNLGPKINTKGDELFPSVAKIENTDSLKLYFSSNGRTGLGGLDVYSAAGLVNNWSEPQTMPYPVNTEKDDFGVMITDKGRQGYIASNRDGEDMTYSMKIEPHVYLDGTAVNKQTGEVLQGATVEVKNLTTNKTDTIVTDEKGHYHMRLKIDSDYTLRAKKNDFYTNLETFSTKNKNKPETESFALAFNGVTPEEVAAFNRHEKTPVKEPVIEALMTFKPIEEHEVIKLNNIYYDFGKWVLSEKSYKELNTLIATLKDNPTVKVELHSYTDAKGSNTFNQKLSQKRAESVVEYLVSQGIAANRLFAIGFGETNVLNKCIDGVPCTNEENAVNRRTEFEVLKK